MPSISSPGIGSGLDINGLVTKLVAAERQPEDLRLANQEAGVQATLSGLGTLKSALADFDGALATLKDSATYAGRTASSSDTTLVTASATSGASAGTFTLAVSQLASAQKLTSAGFAATTTTVGTGTLTIQAGGGSFLVAVATGAGSLSAIRDAINNAPDNSGVSATILTVDDGAGGSISKLVLTATQTGTGNTITVTASDDDGNNTDAAGLSQLVYDPAGSGTTNLTEQTTAKDANFTIDGQAVTRNSNTVSDAISGVTLTLVATSTTATSEVSVSLDQSVVTSAVSSFVNSFNKLNTTLADLGHFDAATGSKGSLLGDSTLRGVAARIRAELATPVSSANSPFATLSAIGVSTQVDGSLLLDSTKLDAALASNFTGVGQFFSASDGVAVRLDASLQDFIESNGVIDSRNGSLNKTISRINDQRTALNRRSAAFEARMRAQFTAMDQLVSKLQSTGNFLVQALAGSSSGK